MNSISINQTDNDMQMKILLFGIFEMVIGFSGAILADFFSVFNLIAFFSGVAGLVALLFCVTQPSKIKVYDILAMALVLAYGTGTLNSLVRYTLDGLDLLKSSAVEEYWLTRSLSLATAAAGFLHVAGRVDKYGYLFEHINIIKVDKKKVLWLFIIISALALLFIASGKLGFMASVGIAKGYVNVSPSAAIIKDLMTPLGATALYIGMKEDSLNTKRLLIGIAMFLLFLQFGFGRRIFVFSSFIYLMTFFFTIKKRGVFSLKNIALFVLVGIVFQFATTTFSVMRISSLQYKNMPNPPSIFEMVPEAINTYDNRDRINLAEQIHENLRSRSFILEYLSKLDKASSTIEPLFGDNLSRSFLLSLPGILYPSKYKHPELFKSEEGYLNPHFRLAVSDYSDTIFTAAIGDFGEVGLFMLPLVFSMFFSLILTVSKRISNPVGSMLISSFLAYRLLSVEEDVSSYFTNIRFVIILLFISWLFFEFNRQKTRKFEY